MKQRQAAGGEHVHSNSYLGKKELFCSSTWFKVTINLPNDEMQNIVQRRAIWML